MRLGRREHSRGWSWARGIRVAGLSAVVALLFLTPLGGGLEEQYGLGALFQFRGEQSAPPGVVIVAIDRASAEELGLPPPPWPRSYHAKLVRALAQHGATAIIFDLLFAKESGSEDDELASAIDDAKSTPVALLQGLERQVAPSGANAQQENLDRTVDPILGGAADAVAPFPLPTDSGQLTRFWTFRDGVPTLPAVALQLATAGADWTALLSTEQISFPALTSAPRESFVQAMAALHRKLQSDHKLALRLQQAILSFEPEKAKHLSALLALYSGDDSRIFSFIGPPGSMATIPYSSVIRGVVGDEEIRGKVVFVGADEREVIGRLDTFKTVFTANNGFDLSGVEALATAFGNLTGQKTLRSSAFLNTAVITAVALVLGLAAASTSAWAVPLAAFSALIGVGALGWYLFVTANLVTPIFTPAAIELPVAALAAAFSITSAERKLRRTIEIAARQFLPHEIAERVTRGAPSRSQASQGTRSGIFLASDIEGFTATAERLSPEALSKLAVEYFEPLFQAVLRSGGEVLDVTGDSMMCVWYADGDPLRARRNAVTATLEMAASVAEFGARHISSPLRTRFALHTGTVALSVVGASGRYVATVVGDVKNAVSRMDSLNKLLGTCVLTSREVVSGLEGLLVRPLGSFAVVGKSDSLALVEILGRTGEHPNSAALAQEFAAALNAFDAEDWQGAVHRFRGLAQDFATDGPTAYFLELAEAYARNPPARGSARPIRVSVK